MSHPLRIAGLNSRPHDNFFRDDPSGNRMVGISCQDHIASPLDIFSRYIWTDSIHPVFAGFCDYGDHIGHAIRDWLYLSDRGSGFDVKSRSTPMTHGCQAPHHFRE
ncbi:hypothetical protein [Singulisphaera sp. PoT]|uniref:hypothetical protein n=1 Tax=Singulisphaera sp. PoT TaxID=3411797 RepID=UPI003BF5811B